MCESNLTWLIASTTPTSPRVQAALWHYPSTSPGLSPVALLPPEWDPRFCSRLWHYRSSASLVCPLYSSHALFGIVWCLGCGLATYGPHAKSKWLSFWIRAVDWPGFQRAGLYCATLINRVHQNVGLRMSFLIFYGSLIGCIILLPQEVVLWLVTKILFPAEVVLCSQSEYQRIREMLFLWWTSLQRAGPNIITGRKI